ncbi:MAG: MDR family oxidoreductase [Acidimicrobiia bacterium]
MFSAIVINEAGDGIDVGVRDVDDAGLPEGDVVVDIEYSAVNYKDALAIVHGKPVVRSFPMVPGVDFAGVVRQSSSARWNVGDAVILNGWNVGEARWGGLAQRARVDGEWLVRPPAAYSTRDAMAVGTAGYTAALCIRGLEAHAIMPGTGPVLVTGASGGVGSFAVILLASMGYDVIAATRTPDATGYLTGLGAREVVSSDEIGTDVRALGTQRWAGAVDTVGGSVLAGVISSTNANGAVAACGNAGGMDLPSSVAPFILRGVTLVGINCVTTPLAQRDDAWSLLAAHAPHDVLEGVVEEIGLADAIPFARRLLANEITGRVVVDVNR